MTAPSDRPRLLGPGDVVLLAAVTVVPLLLGGRGRVNADTKQYLYLAPGDLLERARYLWDARVGGGTVTHQAIGYLWPMGPYYWLTDLLGMPDWAAQRLWIGGIQLLAALGALVLFRYLLPRHPAQLAGAALYGLSPFVLGHVTGQSALLLPFAALGWLVWSMARALEDGGWRWPAVFALIVTTCGSLNGSSLFFVLLAATLWVPFAVWGLRTATWRQGAASLARAAALTVVTQTWWLVAYAVGGRYGLPILGVTEQVQTTSFTTSAAEVVRGLGYWFFYGADSEGPWLAGLSAPYLESLRLLAVSFAVPIAALALGAVIRWTGRAYFALLAGLGTVIAVGAFPEPSRSPLGAAFEEVSRRSELALSLRNTQRAGPLVALGLAGLAAAGLTAIERRHARAGLAGLLGVAVLVAGALPAQWRTGLVAERFHRPEEVPAAWQHAAAYLDQGSGRVLEIPGIDFASYRWGHTLDPVSVGLTRRPILARELVPMGAAPGVTLQGALDRSFQEWWAEPAALVPVARLLGASQVLVRNDLEYERYRTVRPPRLWGLVTDPDAGLGEPVGFGPREPNRASPRRPMVDEIDLALDPLQPSPPQVAVFEVPGGGRPAVSALPDGAAVVVDGDGEGIVHAAAAGLLDGTEGPLLLAADLTRDGGRLGDLAGTGAAFVVTDSNRKRGERWYALRENTGATEPADHPAVLDDPSDARLDLLPDQVDGARTVAEWRGAARIWASAYGSPLTLVPEERPSNAFDGDPRTAWRVDTWLHRAPFRIGIDLDEPVEADHVDLVPPQRRPGTRAVTAARVVLDGHRRFEVRIEDDAARDPAGVRVELDGRPFERLTVEILGVAPDPGPAGFAEVRIPGVEVTEVVALPSALLDQLGGRAAQVPLAIVLARHRADPAEPVRDDPETALARSFELPASVAVELVGTARLSAAAGEAVLDPLLTAGEPPVSSEHLPGDLRSRAAAAFDGDPGTAWRTPFVGLTGQWVERDAGSRVTVDRLDLAVLADARHSLPTRLLISADGGPAVPVDLPDLVAEPDPGTVREVSVELPEPVEGRVIRVTIDEAAPRLTHDWYTGDPIAMPIGLAEVSFSGVGPHPPPRDLDTGCRDDLLLLDGDPVPVRVAGRAGDALERRPLAVEACGGPITLGPGHHELHAAPGAETGIDLDRLVLATPGFRAPAAPAPAPQVEVTRTGPVDAAARVDSDGAPFWLVLDQSVNEGWRLDLPGASVDGPRPIDGFAAGWYVEPDGPGTLVASLRWTPQRLVDTGLLLSALAVLACLLLVIFGPGGRRSAPRPPRLAAPIVGGPQPAGRGWAVVVGAALVAALAIQPLAAPLAGALAAAGHRYPWFGRALPPAFVGLAAAQVLAFQLRDRHDAAFNWPQHFGGAHLAALLAAVLLGALALGEARRGEARPRRALQRHGWLRPSSSSTASEHPAPAPGATTGGSTS